MTAPLFKSLLFSLSKGSFKRYVRPERGWRVANFVTSHYGNYGEVRGVSVMPLRNADKTFIWSISRETYLQETIPCTIQPQKPWYLGENYSRKGIPYDYSCPAAQNIMEKRLCSKCGLYLASIKEVSLHEQMHKKQKTTPSDIPSEPPAKQSAETVLPPRLTPKHVAAR